jgi:hypothetical protein
MGNSGGGEYINRFVSLILAWTDKASCGWSDGRTGRARRRGTYDPFTSNSRFVDYYNHWTEYIDQPG